MVDKQKLEQEVQKQLSENREKNIAERLAKRRESRKKLMKNKYVKTIGINSFEYMADIRKGKLGGFVKYYMQEEDGKKKYKGSGVLLKIDNTNILLTNGYGKMWRVCIDKHIFYYKANISKDNQLKYNFINANTKDDLIKLFKK